MGESTCKSQDYAETWEGGFIRLDAKSRKVYVIRRMINGRNFKVSTRATTLRAAMEQLKRFEAAPEHYSPVGSPHEAPIYPDARSRLNSSPARATWTRTAPPEWRSSRDTSRGGPTNSRAGT